MFISSANAIAETGEIINIDGRGNRLAGQVYGRKTVYIIAGTNKICPDFESAVFRARNTAAVQNCKRFPAKPPARSMISATIAARRSACATRCSFCGGR